MIRGISLEGKKDSTLITWTLKRLRNPVRVKIPLKQGSKDKAIACVRHDDLVKAGQKIAEPADDFSTPLHASVSGRVITVGSFPHPTLDFCDAIEIVGDGKQETVPGLGTERHGWDLLSADSLALLFRDMGLVSLSPGMVPLHVLTGNARQHKIHTLVINACEPEPYVTCDHSLMMSHPLEILKGAEILRHACGAEKVIVALQEDKMQVAELLKSKIYFLKWENIEIRVLPSRFPQGLSLPLLHTLFGLKVSFFPEAQAEESAQAMELALAKGFHKQGIALESVATAYAVYEAVVLQKPLYERPVTVAGECVMEPRNVWIPVGLSLQDTFKSARGLMREPGKVVMGGPMLGWEQEAMEAPVLKGTTAVLALPKEITNTPEVSACTHCGRCVEICPAGISPVMITLAAEQGLYEEAQAWGALDCIRCGNCTYICPSKRPMAELIRDARQNLQQTPRH